MEPVKQPIDLSVLSQVEAESGIKVSSCFQCRKCANGCPMAFAMDYHPFQVVRFIHLGLMDRLVDSKTIWICSSCHTCVTRCPNSIDIPRLMDYLKEKVSGGAGRITEKEVEIFHRQFLKNIKAHGRIFEGGLMQGYLLRTGQIWQPKKMMENSLLGLKMFRKGRLKLTPSRIKGIRKIREIFQRHGQ